jgi:DNA-binding GntR family transcriptional regulator
MLASQDFPAYEPDLEDDEQHPSLSRQAYLRLRDIIVTLHLPPGAYINEAALIEELQLGRTPIREAIQRLSCEGLIVLRPRRGAFVASLSITDLQQIFELRQELEGYAAALAAQRATDADLAAMQAALHALDHGDNTAARVYMEIDRAFHRAVARAAHNRFLEYTLGRMYNLNLRLWYLALDKIGPMREAIGEHREVLEAITRRDSEGARAAIQEHIRHFQTRVKAIL